MILAAVDLEAKISEVRLVSWNINHRGRKKAERQGNLLRELAPHLMLLQEVNRDSSEVLRDAAGADWMVTGSDLRSPEPNDSPVRQRGVAIAGRGLPAPSRKWLLDGVKLPERAMFIETQTAEGTPFIAASYHAPPGVSWKIFKPRQAVAFASWLSTQNGPVLFGADANTPLIDAPDFNNTRTHWHTGSRKLQGEPGDDLLFGPNKKHDLQDAFRRWLALYPHEMDRLGASPTGPLATTYWTVKGKNLHGTERRYDSVWVSRHWAVGKVEHLYERGVAAGSDHAAVLVELDLMST